MKKLILTLLLVFIITLTFGQFPINEPFNTSNTWSFYNGAGIQGGAAATFNTNTTPWLSNSTITFESPILDLTSCVDVSITYQINTPGNNNDPNDIASLEYFDGSNWITLQTFAYNINGTFTHTGIPGNATQFRFKLITDSPNMQTVSYGNGVNAGTLTYDQSSQYYGVQGNNATTYTMFYDVQYFNINCVTLLPVELKHFNATLQDGTVVLNWSTITELNNDYFTIDHSIDGENWENIATVNGAGTTQESQTYQVYDMNPTPDVNYYRLTQTDTDGKEKVYDIITINNQRDKHPLIIKRVNIMGEEINEPQPG